MRRPLVFRRLTAVLSSTALLQLSLLASGTLCPMRGDQATGAGQAHSAHMAHGGHRMAGGMHAPAAGVMSAVATDGSSPNPGLPPGGCDMTGSSCNMPWSPSGCASMSMCAMGVSAPTQVAHEIGTSRAAAIEFSASASLPLGPTYAPELPPPRA